MFEELADDSRKAMVVANQKAGSYCHRYIRREHVFLGLTEPRTELYQKLKDHGYEIDKIRKLVEESLRKVPSIVVDLLLNRQSPNIGITIELAINCAKRLQDNEVRPEHMLYAVMSQSERNRDVISGLKLPPGKLESELM